MLARSPAAAASPNMSWEGAGAGQSNPSAAEACNLLRLLPTSRTKAAGHRLNLVCVLFEAGGQTPSYGETEYSIRLGREDEVETVKH